MLAETNTIRVQARAEDTGGNFAFSPEYTLAITPDATPPQLVSLRPLNGSITAAPLEVWGEFSEVMDVPSLAGGGLTLLSAGADGAFDTSDDAVVTRGVLSFREASLAA